MMTLLKCKLCGGDILATEGAAFGTCDSCGATSTLPKVNEDRIVSLFNRANHFRQQGEFDKAFSACESILAEDAENAEAHWCAVLCCYGIEYVEEPSTGERVPTCHRAQYTPVLSDPDYLAVLENTTDGYARELYEAEAKKINDIQRGILAISGREEPFDVFICYKETTGGGSRTKDSVLAQDIYTQMVDDGHRVFFSRITLEDKLGQEYEPYIFNALSSAKVMLVIGTAKENFEAVWVKNEWSRFLALMRTDRSRLLIPCYRDMDAYDLPDALMNLQALDMGRIGFAQDLLRGVKKVLDAGKSAGPSKTDTSASTAAPGVDSLMKRGLLFLEDSDWNLAKEYFNKVLDIDAEYAPAYGGLLCAELKINKESDLGQNPDPLEARGNFQKAVRFADVGYKKALEEYDRQIKDRIAEAARRELERIAEEERLKQERLEKAPVLAQTRKSIAKYQNCISIESNHIVGLRTDGTVIAGGENKNDLCSTGHWRNIIAVVTTYFYTIGLKADGTVVAVGKNEDGQSDISLLQGRFPSVALYI
jgi:tetratricopeptide (TPR) repeat protein